MSKSPADTLNDVPEELTRAEAQAKASVEPARIRLDLTRCGLGEVLHSVAELIELTASFEKLATRLSALTANPSSRDDVANLVVGNATAVRRLESLLWELKGMVQSLSQLADQSTVDLSRIVPELRKLAEATARATAKPANTATPIVVKIVAPTPEKKQPDAIAAIEPLVPRPERLKN
jgi:hypothetical protein